MKGTWKSVTKIMRKHGFGPKPGALPVGLERVIREMLTEAYVEGYQHCYMGRKKVSKIR